MSNFRRIRKISESNINCFSTSPKNEFVYLFDLHAALFFLGGTACPIVANYFWPCRPVRFSRPHADLKVVKSGDAAPAGIGESRVDSWLGPIDRVPSMANTIKNVSKNDRS
jgi:hypothetical protein